MSDVGVDPVMPFQDAVVWAQGRVGPGLGRFLPPLFAALHRDVVGAGAALHREVVVPLARWVGFSEVEQARMGLLFDVLQVIIDVTDNLADREEDARAGRVWPYGGVPDGILYALPPLLLGHVIRELETGFPGYDGDYAAQRLLGVLNGMVLGQGAPVGSEARLALVAGEQAVALCLPLWLAREKNKIYLEQTEVWARAWGVTWELGAMMREGVLMEGRRLVEAHHRAQRLWPCYGPFLEDGPLAFSRQEGGGLT